MEMNIVSGIHDSAQMILKIHIGFMTYLRLMRMEELQGFTITHLQVVI